jgi:glycosyltransferase involved in cell wall biosynthesis
MVANKSLSIVIPTFNRAEFLNESLKRHIELVRPYDIEIFIFDNASTDGTFKIVQKWQKDYKYLTYFRHTESIGPINTLIFSLKYPKTDYIWLLADGYQFFKENIETVMNQISTSNDFDILVFNLSNKIRIPNKTYKCKNELLYDLGALMTCSAVNIVNKKVIQDIYIDRYSSSYFPHTGSIFEYLYTKTDITVQWIQEYSIIGISNSKLKKINWSHTPKVFEIGCEDWTNFVMSLPPSYTFDNKIKCISDFGIVSGIFDIKNILLLRARNLLNYKTYFKYRNFFKFTINYSEFIIFIIMATPKIFIRYGIKLVIKLFKNDKKHILKSIGFD